MGREACPRARITNQRVALPALAVLAATLPLAHTGCLAPAQRRQDDLSRIVREYNDGLRWRRFEQVVPHLRPAAAERLMARSASAAPDLEIADQEVTMIRVADGATRADVTATFTWYTQRSGVVRKTLVAQDWRFENGRWTCVAQRRLAGDSLPLLQDNDGDGHSHRHGHGSATAPTHDAAVAPVHAAPPAAR